jgi:pyruvate dehydrogenase (quinone)
VLWNLLAAYALWAPRDGPQPIVPGLSWLSGVGLALLAFSASFAAIDWMMSLEPSFWSSVFMMIAGASWFNTGLALVLLVIALSSAALGSGRDHMADLAAILFATTIFWAYVEFVQFLIKLFMDVAKYNNRIMGPAHVENVVELACRTALAYRSVAHVTVPVDLQSMPVDKAPRSPRNLPGHVSEIWADSAHIPTDEALRRAAEVLNAGKRPVILAGRGALGARKELEEAAEILGAPIAKPILGKACVPDESPYCTGGVGLLGTRPSQEALEGCDTLLIVGSCFPYIEFYPKPGQARCVQIDLDAPKIGLRYPVEVGLVGDSIRVLRRLIPLLDRHADRGWIEKAQKSKAEWMKLMEERAARRHMPMKPQVVAHELGKRLKDDAIIVTDSGTITTWVARHVQIRNGQMFSLSGNLATMACGLPYAIGAQAAYPDRQVVAFVGDGGLTMLMGELATAVKYRMPIKVVVINNNSLGQIKWEQMVFLGNPEYVCDLQPIDFTQVARACGATGVIRRAARRLRSRSR